MKRSIYLLVSFMFLGFGVYGKEYTRMLELMPDYDIIRDAQLPQNHVEGIFQVPVVVHVMHLGENIGEGTNISDADVRAGIQGLNNRWRKMPGTAGDGNGVDMEIEFLLAVQDPYGNPTSGIVRNKSPKISGKSGNSLYDDLKKASLWNPGKYLNIWIVNDSLYSHGTANAITCVHHEFLIISVNSFLNSHSVIAHEMGHIFNLLHPFSNTYPDFCKDADGIHDTPKQKESTTYYSAIEKSRPHISLPNSCDPNFRVKMSPTHTGNGTVQDIVNNYMTYFTAIFARNEFTYGQRKVAKYTLKKLGKDFLYENGNTALVSALSGPPGVVDFSSSIPVVIKGGSVTFSSHVFGIPNNYINSPNASLSGERFFWTFSNGEESQTMTSTDQNPTVKFDYPGTYDVTLKVTNAHGDGRVTKSFIVIEEGVGATVDCTASSVNKKISAFGVSKVFFHTLHNSTPYFSRKGATVNDFTDSKNTVLEFGKIYDLFLVYKHNDEYQNYLETWVDWDNSGTFETSNIFGDNEKVVLNEKKGRVPSGASSRKGKVKIPANAVLNKSLRMRVIQSLRDKPKVCGEGFAQRAYDYGVVVKLPDCNGVNASVDFSSSALVVPKSEDNWLYTNKEYPINFTGELTCVPNSIKHPDKIEYHWTFDNGEDTSENETTTNRNLKKSFKKTGTYHVTLEVKDPQGTTIGKVSKPNYVTVLEDGVTASSCTSSSKNNNKDFKCGVTKVSFNTIDHQTTTFIPEGSINDFTYSNNTIVNVGSEYDLKVAFHSSKTVKQYLQVWIDWDNSGTYDDLNKNGIKEKILYGALNKGKKRIKKVKVIPPVTATLNKLLRMRVISNAGGTPKVCGKGSYQRADDYGVMVVVSGCTDPTANNYNSKATLDDGSCSIPPKIGDVVEGGVVYKIDTEKEIAYLALKEDLSGQSGGYKYRFNCHNRMTDPKNSLTDFQPILRVAHEKNLYTRTKDIAGMISCGEEKVASQACMELNSSEEGAKSRIKYFLPSLENFKEAAHEIDSGLFDQSDSYWTSDMHIEFEAVHPHSMLGSWMSGNKFIDRTRVRIYNGSQNETFAAMSELHHLRPFAKYFYGKQHRNLVPVEDLRILEEQISGCTDSLACNFNDQATDKDDSCIYPIHSTSSVTACDSYTWQGQTVTSTQDLKYTYNDSTACGVHTLKVTINHPSSECHVCEEGVYVDHGAILDCHGNCAPQNWLGDGSCDDGSYTSGSHSIYFNCEAFDYDAGDCCPEGEVADCHGNCAPESWLSDGYCDDGSYESGGQFIYFNCEAFNNDQGDCESIETTMMYNVEVSMHDSYGDGWNGNRYEIVNSWGIPVAQGELSSGSSSTDHWTLPADCYKMNVGGGTWQEEVSWDVVVSHPDAGTSIMQGAIGNAIGNFDVSVASGDCASDEVNGTMNWGRLDASTQSEAPSESVDEMDLSASFQALTNLLAIKVKNYGDQKLDYQLYDVLGHLIDENQLTGVLTNINMSQFPEAVYMLKVNTVEKETLKTFKIVKR